MNNATTWHDAPGRSDPTERDAFAPGRPFFAAAEGDQEDRDAMRLSPCREERAPGVRLFSKIVRAARDLYGPDQETAMTLEAPPRRGDRFLGALMRDSSECLTVIDAQGRVTYESPAMAACLGLETEETTGVRLADHVAAEDAAALRAASNLAKNDPSVRPVFQYRRRRSDGETVHFEAALVNRLDDPAVAGLVIWSHNAAERVHFVDELRRLSLTDALTGLPNRVLFLERLHEALNNARRNASPGHVALFLDLDRFKLVNDSLGHSQGDRLLMEIGRRLGDCVGKNDTVARFGGDEFILLVEESEEGEGLRAAERIHAELKRPFLIDGREVFTTASVGIVRVTSDYADPDHIIRDADTAMHEAKVMGKSSGGGCRRLFHAEMRRKAVARLTLETDLRKALSRWEFELHYQPVVELGSGRAIGLEALLRWRHPEKGLVSPLDFIGAAEETGLIHPIGEAALVRACLELRRFNETRPEAERLSVAVNFSASQFDRPDAPARIRNALEMSGLEPDRLTVEITESAIIGNPELASRSIHELREMGARVAIDDFGTGYSSLGYLHRFPFDVLKIDRSFINGLGAGGRNEKIVRAILSLARDLDMAVTAEGVETAEQAERLTAMGCCAGQGYYFARPAPFETIARSLDDLPEAFATSRQGTPSGPRQAGKPGTSLPRSLEGDSAPRPLRELAATTLVVAPSRTVRDVQALLENAPAMTNVVVVEGNRPTGLLMAHELDRRLSTPYGRSLYLDREVSKIMDREPLITSGAQSLEEAASLAMAREAGKVHDDLIVVDEGAFAGTVSVRSMLDAMARMRVETAKGANPLTGLPGNAAIEREIARRTESGVPTSLIYLDLDNFKVYNDVYGFRNGDRIILLAADAIREAAAKCGGAGDFVGHVGGDDFVIIGEPERAEAVCAEICRIFGERSPLLYNERDRERGHILGRGRDGREAPFPLVTVSLGVADCRCGADFSMEELSRRAAEVKKCAKAMPGNSVFRCRRAAPMAS